MHAAAAARACSCDCCGAEYRREAAADGSGKQRLGCAYLEASLLSSFASVQSCGSLCTKQAGDSLLQASQTAEVDTERFCFVECVPRVGNPSQEPQRGGACRPLSSQELAAVQVPADGQQAPTQFLSRRTAVRSGLQQSVLATDRILDVLADAPAAADAAAPAAAGVAAAQWDSVSQAAQEQLKEVAKLAEKATEKAKEAAKDQEIIKDAAYTGAFEVPKALAAVDDARMAAQYARRAEAQVRALSAKVKQQTREAAFSVIPEVLKSLQDAARGEARLAAEKQAADVHAQTFVEAPQVAQKAMQPYLEAMNKAADAEDKYIARGNDLERQAAQQQQQAQELQAQADGWRAVPGEDAAEKVRKLMTQARSARRQAAELNGKAGVDFKTAQSIEETLPQYNHQAAQAAYHAQSLLLPGVQAPLPPLVLSQQGAAAKP